MHFKLQGSIPSVEMVLPWESKDDSDPADIIILLGRCAEIRGFLEYYAKICLLLFYRCDFHKITIGILQIRSWITFVPMDISPNTTKLLMHTNFPSNAILFISPLMTNKCTVLGNFCVP